MRSTSISPTVSTKILKTKEAKNFRKSETEMVISWTTRQRTISIIKKDISKNFTFLSKEIDTRNMVNVMAALIIRKSSANSVNDETYFRANHRPALFKA